MKTIRLALAAALLAAAAAPACAADRNELIAAPIAMILYVNDHCHDMRPNKQAFNAMMRRMGIEAMDDVPASAMRLAHMDLLVLQEQPSATVCPMVWDQFGPNGSVNPDMFLKN